MYAILPSGRPLNLSSTSRPGRSKQPHPTPQAMSMCADEGQFKLYADTFDGLLELVRLFVQVLPKDKYLGFLAQGTLLSKAGDFARYLSDSEGYTEEGGDGCSDALIDAAINFSKREAQLSTAVQGFKVTSPPTFVTNMLEHGKGLLKKLGGNVVDGFCAKNAATVTSLGDMATAPDDAGAGWLNIVPKAGWEDFVATCRRSLLKINIKKLEAHIESAVLIQGRYNDVAAAFKVTSGWGALDDAILAGRVSASAFHLMTAYTQDLKRSDLRTITKEQVALNTSYGIAQDRLPPLLVAKMKSSIKLNAPAPA